MGYPASTSLCVQPSIPIPIPASELQTLVDNMRMNTDWETNWTQMEKDSFRQLLHAVPSLDKRTVVNPICSFLDTWQPSQGWTFWTDPHYSNLEYALIAVVTYLKIMDAEYDILSDPKSPILPELFPIQLMALAIFHHRLVTCLTSVTTPRDARLESNPSPAIEHYIRHRTNLLLNIVTQRDPIEDYTQVLLQKDRVANLEEGGTVDDDELSTAYVYLQEAEKTFATHNPLLLIGTQTEYAKAIQNLTTILTEVGYSSGTACSPPFCRWIVPLFKWR